MMTIQEPRMNGDGGGEEQVKTEHKETWIGAFIHHVGRAKVSEDVKTLHMVWSGNPKFKTKSNTEGGIWR